MGLCIVTVMCLLFVVAPMLNVECCVLKRAKGSTDETPEPITVSGTMGNTVKLPGYLKSPVQAFFKDHHASYASEHIYELTETPLGYRVSIRFLTCTEEGYYIIGSETFNLRAKADTCGMFYYTANVDKTTNEALVTPLQGVLRISVLYIEPDNEHMWSLIEVWNATMGNTLRSGRSLRYNGTVFRGYGGKHHLHFMYQRQGRADSSCSDVRIAAERSATVTNPAIIVPDIKTLEDVETSVKLINVSDSELQFVWYRQLCLLYSYSNDLSAHSRLSPKAIGAIIRARDALENAWRATGAAGSTFKAQAILTPLVMATLVLVM